MANYYPKPSGWMIAAFLTVCLAIALVYNEAVYGDWTCTFAKCVKMK